MNVEFIRRMEMANLQIKGIQDELYVEIKKLAAAENRSMSQEILFLVKDYLARREHVRKLKTPAQVLLDLAGSWEDNREAEQIIAEIKSARKSSEKLSAGF
jgi:predicted CopG family antitoxin